MKHFSQTCITDEEVRLAKIESEVKEPVEEEPVESDFSDASEASTKSAYICLDRITLYATPKDDEAVPGEAFDRYMLGNYTIF